MKKLWVVLRGFLVLIGLCVVALAVFGALGFRHENPPVPDRTVLTATWYGTPHDAPLPPGWVSRFVPVPPTLAEVTQALYRGARDPRVEALAVRLGAGDYNWAAVQDLRAAIAAFRAAGKKTYIYAESYGEMSPGMGMYYLASAFDQIWVQSMGGVEITGFHAEMPYFRSVLDKVGVTPDIIQKGRYKTAPENALLDSMSTAQRESIQGVLSSMMTDFFEGVAQGRHVPSVSIRSLIDNAPYGSKDALAAKLVDRVGYDDEFTKAVFPDPGRAAVDAVDYLYRAAEPAVPADGKSVAVVYVRGMILSGAGDDGLAGADAAYADDIADAIDDAADDPSIAAIVLRVDSPGGSPSASETIRRAVVAAKAGGKYVVVSMGGVAASGGYWLSVDAERIFAQAGTLTGSIGVFGGKVSLAGLWDRLGVRWDGVSMGQNAGMASLNAPYTPTQRLAVNRMLDAIYQGFVTRVAQGRKMTPEAVEAVAQGHVWTGRQALDKGLVDEIGPLRAALAHIAARLNVPGGADGLDIVELPQPRDPLGEIRAIFMGGVRSFALLKPFLREAALAANPARGITYAQGFAIHP